MTTIGMMTAIAILAPEPSPPLEPEPSPEALRAEGVGDLEFVPETVDVLVVDVSPGCVDVTTNTEAVF